MSWIGLSRRQHLAQIVGVAGFARELTNGRADSHEGGKKILDEHCVEIYC